jgi:hypothetical protein
MEEKKAMMRGKRHYLAPSPVLLSCIVSNDIEKKRGNAAP